MSSGLLCLNCRAYIWNAALELPQGPHFCACATVGILPKPSLDARTEATPDEVARWWQSRKDAPHG